MPVSSDSRIGGREHSEHGYVAAILEAPVDARPLQPEFAIGEDRDRLVGTCGGLIRAIGRGALQVRRGSVAHVRQAARD